MTNIFSHIFKFIFRQWPNTESHISYMYINLPIACRFQRPFKFNSTYLSITKLSMIISTFHLTIFRQWCLAVLPSKCAKVILQKTLLFNLNWPCLSILEEVFWKYVVWMPLEKRALDIFYKTIQTHKAEIALYFLFFHSPYIHLVFITS